MAEPVAEVVRAKRFELVDDEGKVRGTLSLHEDGGPALCLCDGEGSVRGRLVLDRGGVPRLTVLSKSGLLRGALGFGTEWKLGLVLTDHNELVVWSAGGEGQAY